MIAVGLTVFKTWALDALSQIHPFNVLPQQSMAPIPLGIKTQTLAVMSDFSFLSLTLRAPCQQILLTQLSDISRICSHPGPSYPLLAQVICPSHRSDLLASTLAPVQQNSSWVLKT